MKLDLVRIWKDEGYRQGLSINPVGDLDDTLLETVYAGELGAGFVGSLASETRVHSFSGLCDASAFSASVLLPIPPVVPLLNIANPTSQTCADRG